MQPSEKRDTIRKEIRRDQLDSYFATRRIKLIEGLERQKIEVESMETTRATIEGMNPEQISP
jgi:hypothetical protein